MPNALESAPTKIVAVGTNYFRCRGNKRAIPVVPKIFLNRQVRLWPWGSHRIAACSVRVDHEAELAVIGERRRNVPKVRVAEVRGIHPANDVTARDHQKTDGYSRGKGL